jgi:hypothetical protein
MSAKKCIHVMVLLDWQLSVADITIPLFKNYASKIGADLNLITQRLFPEWPPEFEKHQIFEAGKGYDWNIHFNADTLIHPDLEDLTATHPPAEVGNWWFRDLRLFLNISGISVFERDGRFYGVDDALLVTSQETHNLWEPLPSKYDLVKGRFKDSDSSKITLLSLSYNFAKFGYTSSGVLLHGRDTRVVNLSLESNDTRSLRERALAQVAQWPIPAPRPEDKQDPTLASVSMTLVNVAQGNPLSQFLQKNPRVSASTLLGVTQATLAHLSNLKDTEVLLLGVPDDAPCDTFHIDFVRSALNHTQHLKRGRALIANGSNSKHRGARRSTQQWGMKMAELAAQHDVALIDLDILQSHHGDLFFYTEQGALNDTGASLVADYILKVVNHRDFSI